MSIDIDVDGTDYPVPSSTRDDNWASKLVAFFQALATALNAAITGLASAAASIVTLQAAEVFTAPVLLNAWENVALGVQVAGHSKSVQGRVNLRGSVHLGADGTICFQLPAGRRPSATESFVIRTAGGFGLASIGIGGDVTLTQITGNISALATLDGISFSTS